MIEKLVLYQLVMTKKTISSERFEEITWFGFIIWNMTHLQRKTIYFNCIGDISRWQRTIHTQTHTHTLSGMTSEWPVKWSFEINAFEMVDFMIHIEHCSLLDSLDCMQKSTVLMNSQLTSYIRLAFCWAAIIICA